MLFKTNTELQTDIGSIPKGTDIRVDISSPLSFFSSGYIVWGEFGDNSRPISSRYLDFKGAETPGDILFLSELDRQISQDGYVVIVDKVPKAGLGIYLTGKDIEEIGSWKRLINNDIQITHRSLLLPIVRKMAEEGGIKIYNVSEDSEGAEIQSVSHGKVVDENRIKHIAEIMTMTDRFACLS